MHHHAAASLAIALDVEAWGGRDAPHGRSATALRQQGWRTVGLGPRDRLETVWQELGRAARARKASDFSQDRHGEVVVG